MPLLFRATVWKAESQLQWEIRWEIEACYGLQLELMPGAAGKYLPTGWGQGQVSRTKSGRDSPSAQVLAGKTQVSWATIYAIEGYLWTLVGAAIFAIGEALYTCSREGVPAQNPSHYSRAVTSLSSTNQSITVIRLQHLNQQIWTGLV